MIKLLASALVGFLVLDPVGAQTGRSIPSTLCGSTVRHWRAAVGYSWCFDMNGRFQEYVVCDSSIRAVPDRFDLVIDSMEWSISKELGRITISAGPTWSWNYRIIMASDSRLMVLDESKSWGVDTLTFSLDVDQTSPILPNCRY